ncbi:hypothetical protein [Coxiella burnetii]|nr:hypothetical protein [Coxiella burnetii]
MSRSESAEKKSEEATQSVVNELYDFTSFNIDQFEHIFNYIYNKKHQLMKGDLTRIKSLVCRYEIFLYFAYHDYCVKKYLSLRGEDRLRYSFEELHRWLEKWFHCEPDPGIKKQIEKRQEELKTPHNTLALSQNTFNFTTKKVMESLDNDLDNDIEIKRTTRTIERRIAALNATKKPLRLAENQRFFTVVKKIEPIIDGYKKNNRERQNSVTKTKEGLKKLKAELNSRNKNYENIIHVFRKNIENEKKEVFRSHLGLKGHEAPSNVSCFTRFWKRHLWRSDLWKRYNNVIKLIDSCLPSFNC